MHVGKLNCMSKFSDDSDTDVVIFKALPMIDLPRNFRLAKEPLLYCHLSSLCLKAMRFLIRLSHLENISHLIICKMLNISKEVLTFILLSQN